MAFAEARADIFYYQDDDGVYHFTNAPGPSRQRFKLDDTKPRKSGSRAQKSVNPSLYEDVIREYADRHDVEVALVKAVIKAESSFNRHAVSRRGARGLMQLMPKTARSHGVYRIHDPRENIRGGVMHLRHLLDRYRNNTALAVAAYNAGSAPVDRYRAIPPYPETRQFVSRVLKYRQAYLRQERLVQN